MLSIEILPAGHGDCIWIECGDPDAPRRILIDGGATGTYKRSLQRKLEKLGDKERIFELLVVTHIDGDHITGILDLLKDNEIGFRAKDVWFNGYRHLPDEEISTLGPVQGEMLTDYLVRPGIRWNAAFDKGAVVVPNSGQLPRRELEGNVYLTVLSPTLEDLARLKPKWEDEVVKAGLDPNAKRPEEVETAPEVELLDASLPDVDELCAIPFSEDNSEANGTSIALLLEFEGHRLLLAGDAHPSVVRDSVHRLQKGKLHIAACKLPHHGSKANVAPGLLQSLDCKTYVFSTNGAYFKHPDREAVARVIKCGATNPELVFNYRSKFNSIWDNKALQEEYGYSACFPKAGSEGSVLTFE